MKWEAANKCKIFVQTSLWEGQPNVFIEALLLKKKVVATNCPGQDKNLRNIFKNIYLINEFSHDKFSKKLVEIFKKKKVFSFKKKINSYDVKKTTKIIINAIEKI